MMQGYCVKCRTKRELKDTKAVTLKNGRAATQGVCSVCGTRMFVIGTGMGERAAFHKMHEQFEARLNKTKYFRSYNPDNK
jgi:hypothetical protein